MDAQKNETFALLSSC